DRGVRIFGAFLLAETALTGFLVTAASTRANGPYVAIGAAAGLLVAAIWWVALRRACSSHRTRMQRAYECEPAGWALLGDPSREPTARRSAEALVGLFLLAHAALFVVGVVHAFDDGGGHAANLPHFIS